MIKIQSLIATKFIAHLIGFGISIPASVLWTEGVKSYEVALAMVLAPFALPLAILNFFHYNTPFILMIFIGVSLWVFGLWDRRKSRAFICAALGMALMNVKTLYALKVVMSA